MNKSLNAHIIVLIATFLVAGSFIVSQKLSGVIDPISITLLRFVVASIFLLPIILMKKNWFEKIKYSFKRALIISFFYSSFFIGMFNALEYTTALNTGTIFTLVPLLTALFSIFVFKQHFNIKQLIIYIIGIIGTCMVIFKGNIDLFLALSLNKGDVIFLFSIIFMALYSISAKYFYKEDDDLMVLVFMTLIGGVIWMSFALYLFNIPLLWENIDTKQFSYLAYLSIMATLVTSYLYQKATVIIGPKKVMSYVYINPAAIALLLFVFEKQSISFMVSVGILISTLATVVLLVKS
jgi:drug/metabolite transporter (DMT)-like permease